MTREEAIRQKKLIDRIEIKIKKLEVDLERNIKFLQGNCPHMEVTTKTIYHEGGYLNTSSYEDITSCLLCKKVLRTVEKSTGSYV